MSPRRKIVPLIVSQHVEDAAVLHETRTALTRAPHVKLRHLRRFDDRLTGHLDGLSIAGGEAGPLLAETLESPSAGALFVATVTELESARQDGLDQLLALAEASPEIARGLVSAFGWLERGCLQGVVVKLLASPSAFKRTVGIAACAMHRVDPGFRFDDPEPLARARFFRTAGEIGQREFVSSLAAATRDPDPKCQLWAAWSAVMLGDRLKALDVLKQAASAEPRAFQLVLLASEVGEAHSFLSRFTDPRALIQGAGFIGDPMYVSWLISQMANDQVARAAGEAFSFITGADLALLDLERKPPENFEAGPNDDPEDPNVDLDRDEDLPWPDQSRVQSWWSQNGSRFTTGVRHLAGEPVTPAQCLEVLKEGYQRQRITAALHRSLLEPGTPLFEWRAPSRRQQSELAQLS